MEIKTNCYAAVDIGASSGRVVIGEVTPRGTIELTEIHRFDNIQKRSGGPAAGAGTWRRGARGAPPRRRALKATASCWDECANGEKRVQAKA